MKTTNSLVIDTSTHRSNQNLNASSSSIMPGCNATVTLRSPPGTLEINGNYHQHPDQHRSNRTAMDKFEIPLPFGYHMDLDFLRFCSEDLGSMSGETLARLRELRKQRRKQRKTLEVLMGIRAEQQSQKAATSARVTRYATTSGLRRAPPARERRPPPPDLVNTDFVKDALKDAVRDFEHHLERSKEDEEERRSGTKTARFNTFPRSLSSPDDAAATVAAAADRPAGSNQTATFKLFRQSSNSSISSMSSVSSAALQGHQSNANIYSPDAVLSALPSSVRFGGGDGGDAAETESIASITSEMSTATLNNIREQMARSLAKLKEYEKQVEAIPVMQARLSVLKEEKRLLMLKLKQRELQLQRDRGEEEEETHEESEGLGGLYYDTEDDEELEDRAANRVKADLRRPFFQEIAGSRARSESPYARGGIINVDDFISVQKRRSASACGYNSDSDLLATPMSDGYGYKRRNLRREEGFVGRMSKSQGHHNLSTPHIERAELGFYPSRQLKQQRQPSSSPLKKSPKEARDAAVMTDPLPDPPPKVVEVIKQAVPPPPPSRRDRGVNTDPPPRSPPPPRKVSHGTNTLNTRMVNRSTGTLLGAGDVFSRDEMEGTVQEAVLKTEEEIMGCPLLQRAMAKVEEEAIHGPRREVEKMEAGCQVGEENLRPFVISVGLQCKLDDSRPIVVEKEAAADDEIGAGSREGRVQRRSIDPETEKLVRSVGVGEYKLVEDPPDPTRFKDAAVCTEKWVEVIKASKQTDTEDFAFKDTESPRVADLFRFEPSPERVVLERRSSLRRQGGGANSPSLSRRSSANSPNPSRKSSALSSLPKVVTRTQGTMTLTEVKVKVPTRDVKVGAVPTTKSVSTSALALTGLNVNTLPAPGSPLTTPEREKPSVNVCDKCNSDIQKVAKGVLEGPSKIQPPSPNMPWLSKIPRPVVENPSVHKLKSASSIGNLSLENRSQSPLSSSNAAGGGGMQRSKSTLTPAQGRKLMSPGSAHSPIPVGRRDVGTPPPHPATPPLGAAASGSAVRRISSPLARSQSPHAPVVPPEKRSLIPKLSPVPQRKQVTSRAM